MRILPSALAVSVLLITGNFAEASAICGVFKAVVFVPEDSKAEFVLTNPKSVTQTKLILSKKKPLERENVGRLLEIEFRSSTICYGECEVELVRVLRQVSPFESMSSFHRDQGDLVSSEVCKKSQMEAIGL